MKYTRTLLLLIALFILCSCAVFDAEQADRSQTAPSKPLALPVGKNWQIVEEPPQLSDERGRLPFHTEQSVQPDGLKSAAPADKRKIETTQ